MLCIAGGGEGVLDPEVLAQLPQSMQLDILEKLRDAAQAGKFVHILILQRLSLILTVLLLLLSLKA
jgi:hypothetical protein